MLEDFDFTAWARLAKDNPAQFEAVRKMVIDEFIATRDDQPRMRRLQWRVDAERARARTPYKSCMRISALMWDAFYNLRDTLNGIVGYDRNGVPKRRQRPRLRLMSFNDAGTA